MIPAPPGLARDDRSSQTDCEMCRLSVLDQARRYLTLSTDWWPRVSRPTKPESSSPPVRLDLPHPRTSLMIPTGFQSKELIIKAGLVLGDVDQYPYLDVTIDGADE